MSLDPFEAITRRETRASIQELISKSSPEANIIVIIQDDTASDLDDDHAGFVTAATPWTNRYTQLGMLVAASNSKFDAFWRNVCTCEDDDETA